MEATKMASPCPWLGFPASSTKTCPCGNKAAVKVFNEHANQIAKVGLGRISNKRPFQRVAATIIDGDVGADLALDDLHVQAGVTWQIVVGAIAGVTPFVVAGIEFSKRIIAQRRCEVCKGSGLVLRDKYYFRCPGCGGFLPWQSWKRFFTG